MNPYLTKETTQVHLFLIHFQAFHQLAHLINPDFIDILKPKGYLKDKSLGSAEILKRVYSTFPEDFTAHKLLAQ